MVAQGRADGFVEGFTGGFSAGHDKGFTEQEKNQGEYWQPYSHAALEAALSSGKTVIVEFTADWCVNCKVFEATVLRSAAILALLDERGIVSLQADCTREGEGTELLLRLGPNSVPTLAIFDPANPTRPTVVRGFYTISSLTELLQ